MGTPAYPTQAPATAVLRRLPIIMLPAGALLVLTYFVPGLNPFALPHRDLTGPVALAAYWVAASADPTGAPLVGLLLTAIVVSRSSIVWRRRGVEVVVIVLAAAAASRPLRVQAPSAAAAGERCRSRSGRTKVFPGGQSASRGPASMSTEGRESFSESGGRQAGSWPGQ
jgi:hypothetical protein